MAKRQKELPGMELPVIQEVVDAAEDYVGKRDDRMELTKLETAAQAVLMAAMEKHELIEYLFDGKKITIEQGPKKVSVKTLKVEDGGDPD